MLDFQQASAASASIKSLCPFKSSITKNALLESLKSVAAGILTANSAHARQMLIPNTRNYYDIYVHVPQTFSPIPHGRRDIAPTLLYGLKC